MLQGFALFHFRHLDLKAISGHDDIMCESCSREPLPDYVAVSNNLCVGVYSYPLTRISLVLRMVEVT